MIEEREGDEREEQGRNRNESEETEEIKKKKKLFSPHPYSPRKCPFPSAHKISPDLHG